MTDFFSFCGILVISSAMLTILSEREKQLSSLISSLIYIISFVYILGKASSLFDKATKIFGGFETAIPIEYIMQMCGIAILGTVCTSLCEQVGQKGIGAALEIFAIVEAMYISFPWCTDMIKKVFLIFGD